MLSATTLGAILSYTNGLKPKFVKKVRETTFTFTIFVLGVEAGDLWVAVDPGQGVFLPIIRRPKLKPSRGFILNLKRKIERARILGIDQPPLERIVHFHLHKGGEEIHLYIELFGGGNIILTDQEGKILSCMRTLRVRHRTIKPGDTYRFPPIRGLGLHELDFKKLSVEASSTETGLAAFLVSNLALGKDVVEEALARLDIAKEAPANGVDNQILKSILEEMNNIVTGVLRGEVEPTLICRDGVPATLVPFKPTFKGEARAFDSLLEASDELFYECVLPRKMEEARVRERIPVESKSRLILKLEDQRQELVKKSKEIRASAENLYPKVRLLEEMFTDILDGFKDSKVGDLVGRKYGSLTIMNIDPKNRRVAFSDVGYTYSLDFTAPPISSIGELYEKAKKVERGVKSLNGRIEKLREEVKDEAEREEEGEVFEVPELRKKRWYEKFKWTLSSDDHLILAGRDASSNEMLIKKYSRPEDVVFHADVHASPFVLVKANGETISETTISEAAVFTASHGRGWRLKLGAIDVYWVKPSQVTKKAPSGEYLKRGSFMVYGKRNYIRNTKLELAVGIVRDGGHYSFMVGPPSAVSKHCLGHVVIVPGRSRKLEAARKMVKTLLKKVGEEAPTSTLINRLAEDLLQYLPPGGIRVLDKVR